MRIINDVEVPQEAVDQIEEAVGVRIVILERDKAEDFKYELKDAIEQSDGEMDDDDEDMEDDGDDGDMSENG